MTTWELKEAMTQRRLSDVIYDALMDALVSGRLAPGQLLHDRELAEDLQVSRTPVREALQRLQEVGLVEIAPGRFTRVTPMEPAHVADVCLVVGQMSALATELGSPRLGRADYDILDAENGMLAKAHKAKDAAGVVRSEAAFYDVFLKAAQNPVLVQITGRLTPRVARWQHASQDWKAVGDRLNARREAATAARSGDAAKTARVIRSIWLDQAEQVRAAGSA
jgi:DNA-binding GntR family transcriptional regulator